MLNLDGYHLLLKYFLFCRSCVSIQCIINVINASTFFLGTFYVLFFSFCFNVLKMFYVH